MSLGHLKDLDLNLLVALDALLEERNVTRAARRLGISQSALSHRLRRLREELGDSLFVATQNGLLPTPRAESMADPLRRGLLELGRAVVGSPEFDPHTSERSFRIATVDQAEVAFVAPVLSALAEHAPGIRMRLLDANLDVVDRMERGEVDMYVTTLAPERVVIRRMPLTEFDIVGLVRIGHPRVQNGSLSMEDYTAVGHVVVTPSENSGRSFVDDTLMGHGQSRKVMLRVPRFAGTPFLVAQTDFLLTTTRPFAEACARLMPVQVVELPFEAPRFTLFMYWHERDQDDPAHRWMRDFMVKQFRDKNG